MTLLLQRRAFLACALCGVGAMRAYAARPQRAPLALALVLPPDSAALHGARFGAAEAAHAARLMQAQLDVREYVPGRDAAAAAARAVQDGADAIVGGGTEDGAARLAAARLGALVVNVGGTADTLRTCAPRLFHTAPSEGMLRSAAEGTDDVVLAWHPSLTRYGAGQLNDRYNDVHPTGMDGAAWCAWMAVKVVWESALRAGSAAAAELDTFLVGRRAIFDGHKGMQLSFHPLTRQLRQPLYRVADDTVTAEVPSPRLAAQRSPADVLDTLGAGTAPCVR